MSDPFDRALDEALAGVGQTSTNDQLQAALGTLARGIAYYYHTLLALQVPEHTAAILTLDYQRTLLEQSYTQRREQS